MARIEKVGTGHYEYRGYRFLISEDGETVGVGFAFSYRNLGNFSDVHEAARFVDIREGDEDTPGDEEAAREFRNQKWTERYERAAEAKQQAMS